MNQPPDKQGERPNTIRDLYPTLTDQELREAEDNLRRYIEVVLRVYEESRGGGENSGVDSSQIPSTMKERSNVPLKN